MYRRTHAAVFGALVGLLSACDGADVTSPVLDEVPEVRSPALALLGTNTVTETYRDVTLTLTWPELAEPDTDFGLDVAASVANGSPWGVFGWWLFEDAEWYYSTSHRAVVTSGTFLEGDGFNWGSDYANTFVFNRPAGTYRFTFVFGQRSGGHGWYDVAADVEVTVGPSLCDEGWHSPTTAVANAGRVVALKFTANDCDTGELHVDQGVTVEVVDADGAGVASWVYTGNPSTGVHIGEKLYHVNWDTDRGASGDYVVTVRFSNGAALTRTITLR